MQLLFSWTTWRDIEGALGMTYIFLLRDPLMWYYRLDPDAVEVVEALHSLAFTSIILMSTHSFLVSGIMQTIHTVGEQRRWPPNSFPWSVWGAAICINLVGSYLLVVPYWLRGALMASEMAILWFLSCWGPDSGLWNRHWARTSLQWALTGSVLGVGFSSSRKWPYFLYMFRVVWKLCHLSLDGLLEYTEADLLTFDRAADLLTLDPNEHVPAFLDVRSLVVEANWPPRMTTALSVVAPAETMSVVVNDHAVAVAEVLAEPEDEGAIPIWGALLRRVFVQAGGATPGFELFMALFSFLFWVWS
jgi:hypothetical protein